MLIAKNAGRRIAALLGMTSTLPPLFRYNIRMDFEFHAPFQPTGDQPKAILTGLYNELTMPLDLRKAHNADAKAVWDAYDRAWPLDNEPANISHLMTL